MVYFGCKITKKTVIFQNFLQKNIKISVFFALYVPNAGGNALFIGKKRGYHTISSRQPLEILHICYQIVHYILYMYARELLLFNYLTTLFYGLHIQRNQIVVTFRQCLLQRLLNTRCTYDGSNLQQSA